MGPIIIDLLGLELSQEEAELLKHPHVAGVILFSRNYSDPEQLVQLCKAIRAARSTPMLITVDHEGGRVQRFRAGFTVLPSMGSIGAVYAENPEHALKTAEACGWIMAAELLAVGIDLSFAPILDLNRVDNPAIGDRAFHQEPLIVSQLAMAAMRGMKKAGMAATGKHFPGHGSVTVDSHKQLPVDTRQFEMIAALDLQPFEALIAADIPAIMPAHIVFSAVDPQPVGFSKIWLQTILRKQLNFSGVIFSDDLNMEAAGFAGDYADRATAALDAGCDIALICNNRPGALQILNNLPKKYTLATEKFNRLQGQFSFNLTDLRHSSLWKSCKEFL